MAWHYDSMDVCVYAFSAWVQLQASRFTNTILLILYQLAFNSIYRFSSEAYYGNNKEKYAVDCEILQISHLLMINYNTICFSFNKWRSNIVFTC